jgi:hypothetical protein
LQEHNLITIVVIRDRSHKTERDLCEISQNYADLELDLNELIIRILLKSKKDFWFNKSTNKNKIRKKIKTYWKTNIKLLSS